LRVDSWSNESVVGYSPASKDIAGNIIRIRYQETTSKVIEIFIGVADTVIFRGCKPVRLLQLLVVTSCV
jgi:hypothetical protein